MQTRDQLESELEQAKKLNWVAASRDQPKSELEQRQRLQQDTAKSKERKLNTMSEPLVTRSRPESKMEVDETPNATGRFNVNRGAQEQLSDDLETGAPPEPTPPLRDLELSQSKPLAVDVVLPGLTPSSTGGSQGSARSSRLKELQERLQARTPKIPASEGQPSTWKKQPVRGANISNYKECYHILRLWISSIIPLM